MMKKDKNTIGNTHKKGNEFLCLSYILCRFSLFKFIIFLCLYATLGVSTFTRQMYVEMYTKSEHPAAGRIQKTSKNRTVFR